MPSALLDQAIPDRPSSGPERDKAGFLEALDPATDVMRLAALARSPDWWVRAQVAERLEVPFEVVGMLSHDECAEVVAAVVGRPDLQLPTLQELLTHQHAGVRAGAAEHPALSPALQAIAAMDSAVQVRLAVANRADLLGETVRLLARDEARVVRAAVLANPMTPRRIWREGLKDVSTGNRLLLLERSDLSPGVALTLAADQRLYALPAAKPLIKAALIRALRGLRPARRRGCIAELLDSEVPGIRAVMIEALGKLTLP